MGDDLNQTFETAQLENLKRIGSDQVDNSKDDQDKISDGVDKCPVASIFGASRSFWNVAASLWGYYYGELSRLGSVSIAASQITGYPAGYWNIHGKPVNLNYPCVSMMDWRDKGSDTARSWALQMTIDVLGNADKRIFSANISSSQRPSSSSHDWPLPSTVYGLGFELFGGERVILLSNTNSSAENVLVVGASGGTIHVVDSKAGFGDVPYSTQRLADDLVLLGPSAVALIRLPSPEQVIV